jgi:hypothetical protein
MMLKLTVSLLVSQRGDKKLAHTRLSRCAGSCHGSRVSAERLGKYVAEAGSSEGRQGGESSLY